MVPRGTAFGSVTPARVLDTRAHTQTVDGQFQGGGPIGPDAAMAVLIAVRAAISDDAQVVVFGYRGNVIVDPEASADHTVWLRNLTDQTTTRIDTDDLGRSRIGVEGWATSPALSGDGRYATFTSDDGNIDPNTPPGNPTDYVVGPLR